MYVELPGIYIQIFMLPVWALYFYKTPPFAVKLRHGLLSWINN